MDKLISIKKNSTGNVLIPKSFSDTLKLLACLLVALSHYSQYMILEGNTNLTLSILAGQGGYLGVAFFFFFSGYGLNCSLSRHEITFSNYIKKRVSKVYTPAVFVSLIWVCILFFLPCLQDKGLGITEIIDISNILTSLLKVFALNFYDSILWFVGVIMILYIVVFVYDYIKQKNVLALSFLIISTICVTISVYYVVAPFASISIFAFAIGVIISDFGLSICNNRSKYILVSMAILSIFGALSYFFPLMVHALINYTLLFFFILICMYYELRFQLPNIIASISYDIYLTHKKTLVILFYLFNNHNVIAFVIIMLIIAFIEQKLRNLVKL